MIIFYDKKTGQIAGTIDGRIHPEDHMKMWVGDKKENGRIVVNWKPVKWFDKDGKQVKKNNKNAMSADFAPDIKGDDQKQIFYDLDQTSRNIKNYIVDPLTATLKNKV